MIAATAQTGKADKQRDLTDEASPSASGPNVRPRNQGTTTAKSGPARDRKCESLKVDRERAFPMRAQAAMIASWIRPPEMPAAGAPHNIVLYSSGGRATTFTDRMKFASIRLRASAGERRWGAGRRVRTEYAAIRAGAATTMRSLRFSRLSIARAARSWCSCQEHTAAIMQPVSGRKAAILNRLPVRGAGGVGFPQRFRTSAAARPHVGRLPPIALAA